MDPYLEDPAFWSDFHSAFLTYLSDALNECLPDNYEARLDEKINLIESSPDRIRLLEPDLAVSQDQPSAAGAAASAGVATLEPVTIPHLPLTEEVHERWIEILHRPDRSLVTVLEVLSPANKEEPGFRRFLDKRNALLCQNVHLVEVDLLLGGHRLPLAKPLPRGDYYILLSRRDQRPDCQVFSWTLRQPLPPLPVPLLAPDPDVVIDLRTVFTTVYDRRRYRRSLPYSAPPVARLAPALRQWVLQTLEAGTPDLPDRS
jgi:hypothetical protein